MNRQELLSNFSLETYLSNKRLAVAQDSSFVDIAFNFLSNVRASVFLTSHKEDPCFHACLASITCPRPQILEVQVSALNIQSLAAAYGVALSPISCMTDVETFPIMYLASDKDIAHSYLTIPLPMPGDQKRVILFDLLKEDIIQAYPNIHVVEPALRASTAFKVSTLFVTENTESPVCVSLLELLK